MQVEKKLLTSNIYNQQEQQNKLLSYFVGKQKNIII